MKRLFVGWRFGMLAVFAAVAVLLLVDFNSRMSDWRRLSIEKEAVAATATSVNQTQVHLETQIAFATSPAGVFEWAYEEGHMVREGDVLVVPLAETNATLVPTPVPIQVQEPVSNWELWLSLIIDLP